MKKLYLHNIHCRSRKDLHPLICRAAGFVSPPAGYRELSSANRDLCGIFWCSGGSAKFEIAGNQVRLFSGDAICYLPGENHCIEVDNTGFSYYWAVWQGILAANILTAYNIPSGKKIHVSESLKDKFSALFDTMRINSIESSYDGGVILDSIFSSVAKSHCDLNSGEGNWLKSIPLVEQFKDLVMGEFHDPMLNLDALSQKIGVHRSTIDRAVKKYLGVAPGKYLQDVRLQAALGRLKSSAGSVNVICRECGFSNPSYFSRVVREKTGLSPKEYREKGE